VPERLRTDAFTQYWSTGRWLMHTPAESSASIGNHALQLLWAGAWTL
jgi:hypothetical protein